MGEEGVYKENIWGGLMIPVTGKRSWFFERDV